MAFFQTVCFLSSQHNRLDVEAGKMVYQKVWEEEGRRRQANLEMLCGGSLEGTSHGKSNLQHRGLTQRLPVNHTKLRTSYAYILLPLFVDEQTKAIYLYYKYINWKMCNILNNIYLWFHSSYCIDPWNSPNSAQHFIYFPETEIKYI